MGNAAISCSSEHKKVVAERDGLTEERDSLHSKLKAAESEKRELTAEKGALQAEKSQLTAEKSELASQVDHGKTKLTEAATENELLRSEWRTLKQKADATASELQAERLEDIVERKKLLIDLTALQDGFQRTLSSVTTMISAQIQREVELSGEDPPLHDTQPTPTAFDQQQRYQYDGAFSPMTTTSTQQQQQQTYGDQYGYSGTYAAAPQEPPGQDQYQQYSTYDPPAQPTFDAQYQYYPQQTTPTMMPPEDLAQAPGAAPPMMPFSP